MKIVLKPIVAFAFVIVVSGGPVQSSIGQNGVSAKNTKSSDTLCYPERSTGKIICISTTPPGGGAGGGGGCGGSSLCGGNNRTLQDRWTNYGNDFSQIILVNPEKLKNTDLSELLRRDGVIFMPNVRIQQKLKSKTKNAPN